MTKTIQWVSVALSLCAAIASQVDALRSILPPTAVVVIMLITNVVSSTLPSLLAAPAKAAEKTLPSLLCLLTLAGCSMLQPAKEPAKEVWYAAELLCAQDLEQYAEVQAIAGAAQLIREVCADVAVVDPYVDALLKQNRGRDPMAQPRANAVAVFRARAK